MASRYYVPLVFVHIDPNPNADIPAIEKTRRSVTAAVYAVPLYKSKWGRRAKITTEALPADRNPYYEITSKNGEDVVDMEIDRLKRHFNSRKQDVFHEVYSDTEFADRFHAVAKTENPWLANAEAAAAKAEEEATNVAAEKLVQAAAKAQGEKAAKRVRAEQEKGAMHEQINAAAQAALADAESDEQEAAAEAEDAPPEPEIPRRGKRKAKPETAEV